MKNKLKMLSISVLLLVTMLFAGCSFSCAKTTNHVRGVWWWDKSLGTEYLDFAEDNNINEIYYCDSSFNEKTEDFISVANSMNMKVYLLAGEYQWIEDNTKLRELIINYIAFQETTSYKFAGIHLDIEPHQHDEWDTKREELLLGLITLVDEINTDFPDISFTYDIPMWFDDLITYNDKTQEAFKHIIDYADRVVVMSYRDTVEDIYEVFKDEYLYGMGIGTPVLFSVETGDEENKVTFKEEGKKILNDALNTLLPQINENLSGYAIHHIKTWYELGA